jgi:hypothetical protein
MAYAIILNISVPSPDLVLELNSEALESKTAIKVLS